MMLKLNLRTYKHYLRTYKHINPVNAEDMTQI